MPEVLSNPHARKGIPVDDPSQIVFPQLKSGTAWGFQEEAGLIRIIDRYTSLSDLNAGITPSPGEPARTQGGIAALLQEGSAPLDVSFRRYTEMYSDILHDMHQMLIEKLPKQFQHIIVGEDDQPTFGTDGLPIMQAFENSRIEVAGKVHFHIQARRPYSGTAPYCHAAHRR